MKNFEATATPYNMALARLMKETGDSYVLQFVDKVIEDAIFLGASDIHFEPFEHCFRIRVRIDGLLEALVDPPVNRMASITSRLKIMAHLDIAERRVPQDGRFKFTCKQSLKTVDFRVNTCPTLFGEKIVLRLLDACAARLDIPHLGFTIHQQENFLKSLAQPQGLVIVTGPTGSGKTVTLYTGLNHLNTIDKNISTVEDPVEINLPGVNQVNIHPKAGLTFAHTLRAFLRQDPDIIMVGEIRDPETAEIALKAAQTGHLVLSTLHTNSAPETLIRLRQMGVPTYNIANAISLIVAQRLVRKLCKFCKQAVKVTSPCLLELGVAEADLTVTDHLFIANPQGCPQCHLGYKGRTGLFEVLPISQALVELILADGSILDIAQQARKEGVLSIAQHGLQKILAGETSVAEVQRVTFLEKPSA